MKSFEERPSNSRLRRNARRNGMSYKEARDYVNGLQPIYDNSLASRRNPVVDGSFDNMMANVHASQNIVSPAGPVLNTNTAGVDALYAGIAQHRPVLGEYSQNAIDAMSFNDAFAAARKAGVDTFTWRVGQNAKNKSGLYGTGVRTDNAKTAENGNKNKVLHAYTDDIEPAVVVASAPKNISEQTVSAKKTESPVETTSTNTTNVTSTPKVNTNVNPLNVYRGAGIDGIKAAIARESYLKKFRNFYLTNGKGRRTFLYDPAKKMYFDQETNEYFDPTTNTMVTFNKNGGTLHQLRRMQEGGGLTSNITTALKSLRDGIARRRMIARGDDYQRQSEFVDIPNSDDTIYTTRETITLPNGQNVYRTIDDRGNSQRDTTITGVNGRPIFHQSYPDGESYYSPLIDGVMANDKDWNDYNAQFDKQKQRAYKTMLKNTLSR